MNTKLLILPVIIVLCIGIASAVPSGGAAFDVSSNNFTVTLSGSDGGETWIAWGQVSGAHPWGSNTITGDGDIRVFGAPIIGGSTIYYVACDSTGCDTSEQTVTISEITPLPTPTFGNAYKNMTQRRFSIDSIAPNVLPGYLATGIAPTMLWGLMFFFIWFGFWFRTRSVRLALIVGLLMAAFIVTPTAGLMLGAPLLFQYVAQGLMAAALAGILVGFIRR